VTIESAIVFIVHTVLILTIMFLFML